MPQFPEKDSLLLSKLVKSAPWMAKLHESKDSSGTTPPSSNKISHPKPEVSAPSLPASAAATSGGGGDMMGGLGDLLGINTEPPPLYGNDYEYHSLGLIYLKCYFFIATVNKSQTPPMGGVSQPPQTEIPSANGFDDFLVSPGPSNVGGAHQPTAGADEGFRR